MYVYTTSTPPPPTSQVTWAEYSSSPPGAPPLLARKIISKTSSKQFKATVAMSEEFPMEVEMLLAVLEVIAPQFKHFKKLRNFVQLKLPPGYPIQVNIPVLPTVSAKITFTDFKWSAPGDPALENERYEIPKDKGYTLDPNRYCDCYLLARRIFSSFYFQVSRLVTPGRDKHGFS